MENYLENCNEKELKEIGLLNQTELAEYLEVTFRTTNRRVSQNEDFCYPISIKKRKFYHPKLIDKYCEEFPATRKQIKENNQKVKMQKAKNHLNKILKGELNGR